MYIHIYVYVCIYVYVHIYTYIKAPAAQLSALITSQYFVDIYTE